MNDINRFQSNAFAALCAFVMSAVIIGVSVMPAELINAGSLVI